MYIKIDPVFVVNTVDMFCGGGGASTGCDKACVKLGFRRMGFAVNHWSSYRTPLGGDPL